MLIEDITHSIVERQVWARKGNNITRKTRCGSGPRKGKLVSDPAKCHEPINIKKRIQMKKTRATKGAKMTRKAKKTKRINPASKKIKRLNK